MPDWAALVDAAPRTLLMGKLLRIVESQQQVATTPLVDNLAEHDVLEGILERSKPPRPNGTARFDYLLATPWRYPPLRWGSRFGARHLPSLFYGSLTTAALFAEAAYYRFVFLSGMAKPFVTRVISQHTVFTARYRADNGVQLEQKPFGQHQKLLTHPSNYTATQAIGEALRAAQVSCFTFASARSKNQALNIALIDPKALRSNKHQEPEQAICEMQQHTVMFRYRGEVLSFQRSEFEIAGTLPSPA